MDFHLRKSPNRILLLLSNPADEKMLRQSLPDDYEFLEADTETSIHSADLFILDASKFNQYRDEFSERKEKLSPEYLPVIVLVKQHHFEQFLNKWSGEVYDDILPIPISPIILKTRIQSLLKQRHHSLELQKENYLANKAIDATEIGISISNYADEGNHPMIFVNEGFEKLTGYKKSEVIGKDPSILLRDDLNQEGLEKINKAIDSRTSTRVLLRNYKKDGSLFWNELTFSPIEDADEENNYFVGIQNDVTELISIQNELKELLGEKEVLLQEIHHRIKNNLAVIVALLEMKIMDTENEETVSSLQETRTRIFSISKVHELLYEQENFNQIEFPKYVKGLVDHLTDMYCSETPNISIALDLDMVTISIDQAVPCGMLLSELITNSFKHAFDTQNEGEIRLGLKKTDGRLFIKVTDDGKGLPEGKELKDMPGFAQSIVPVLLQQLDADWDCHSDGGFTFIFNFELQSYTGVATDEKLQE